MSPIIGDGSPDNPFAAAVCEMRSRQQGDSDYAVIASKDDGTPVRDWCVAIVDCADSSDCDEFLELIGTKAAKQLETGPQLKALCEKYGVPPGETIGETIDNFLRKAGER